MKQFTECACEPCYPAEFPSVAISNVISYLQGTGDLACALHCAWVIQGFAMSFIPHNDLPPTVGHDKCPTEMTDEELATALRETTAPRAEADSAWLILLMPLIEVVIKRLLDRLKK